MTRSIAENLGDFAASAATRSRAAAVPTPHQTNTNEPSHVQAHGRHVRCQPSTNLMCCPTKEASLLCTGLIRNSWSRDCSLARQHVQQRASEVSYTKFAKQTLPGIEANK